MGRRTNNLGDLRRGCSLPVGKDGRHARARTGKRGGKAKARRQVRRDWEIDGKGVKADEGAIVVIECRRYTTSKLKQEAMGGLAYKIGDVGAAGGIVVTPIGVQEGGEKISKYEGIQIVHLDADSTTTDYVLKFLNNVVHRCVAGESDSHSHRSSRSQVTPPRRRRNDERASGLERWITERVAVSVAVHTPAG